MYDFRLPNDRVEDYNVITNGKGGIYRWAHDELPNGVGWAWVQKKPIDPKFWALARWQMGSPRTVGVPESCNIERDDLELALLNLRDAGCDVKDYTLFVPHMHIETTFGNIPVFIDYTVKPGSWYLVPNNRG